MIPALESRPSCPPPANCRAAFPRHHGHHGPTSPHRPETSFPSRKPKGTLKTPKDTENNCHHTQHKSAIPNQPLRTTVRLVMGWANMPTQHETPSQRSSASPTSCQKAGQAQLHTKLNEISFLVLLSFISWPMLNYLKPSFINLPQLFSLNL